MSNFTSYARQPSNPGEAGQRFNVDSLNDIMATMIVPEVDELPSIDTITVVSVADGNVAVTIDGVSISVTATADATADAASLAAAIEANAAVTQLVDATSAAAVVTVTGKVDGVEHAIVDTSTGSSTATPAEVQAAAAYDRIQFGLGVTRASSGGLRGVLPIAKPSAVSDAFVGVTVFYQDNQDQDSAEARRRGLENHLASDILPGTARYGLLRKGAARVTTIDAATQDAAAYLIMTGDNAGKWTSSAALATGVAQVDDLTFANAGGGTANGYYTVGGVDLNPIIVADQGGTDADNAAAWAAAFNAHGQYGPIATAVATAAVVTVTFNNPGVAYTFTNTADTITITKAVDTLPVAATAKDVGAKFLLSASAAGNAPIQFDGSAA